jgi:hypothetical protein
MGVRLNQVLSSSVGASWIAPLGQDGTHKPQPSQRSAQMAMRAGSQGTSMVEQYFTHFAQQKFIGSSIA